MAGGLGLLVLNLWSFPYAPGDSGSVDLGPAVAVWSMAVFVRLALLKPREGTYTGIATAA